MNFLLLPSDSLPCFTDGRVFMRLSGAYCHLEINYDNVFPTFPAYHAWAALRNVWSILLHKNMLLNFSRCLSILPDFHKTPWKHFVYLESQVWLRQESKYSGYRTFCYATGAIQCAHLISFYRKVTVIGWGWSWGMIKMALGNLGELSLKPVTERWPWSWGVNTEARRFDMSSTPCRACTEPPGPPPLFPEVIRRQPQGEPRKNLYEFLSCF